MKSLCKLKSGINFKGRDALKSIDNLPIKRRLLGFSVDDATIDLNGGEVIYRDGSKIVGYIKRSGYGYTVNKHIGYGYIEIEESERKLTAKETVAELMNSSYELEVMGKKVKAKPSIKALYDSNRRKILL
jgi:4-methylaminobutanoate oxidase (formaldehyde-forming)